MAISIRRSPALFALFIFFILELTALHSSTNSALVDAVPTPLLLSNILSKRSSSSLSPKPSRGQVADTVINNNNNNNNNDQKRTQPALGGRRRRPQNNGRNPFLMQNFELSGHDGSHQDLAQALGIVVKKKVETTRRTEPKHGTVKARKGKRGEADPEGARAAVAAAAAGSAPRRGDRHMGAQ